MPDEIAFLGDFFGLVELRRQAAWVEADFFLVLSWDFDATAAADGFAEVAFSLLKNAALDVVDENDPSLL
eukprot:CAMPEP_0197267468 /NCGR_PEP_ID=MMETSP1432-20130617/3601_1 /TAXON_ID=44447 /ORGANISM="Pseudo-nitzschia delicatissima, Strain UNC1205" /LENGTH=69 /DNA_ID=CAMNT_0042732423 /DNA_START=219 /DNA_END=428 /DNA_ORIENTATION=+